MMYQREDYFNNLLVEKFQNNKYQEFFIYHSLNKYNFSKSLIILKWK